MEKEGKRRKTYQFPELGAGCATTSKKVFYLEVE